MAMQYENGRRVTWIIEMAGTGKENGESESVTFSGVSLRSADGLVIVTCSRFIYDFLPESLDINVRRFGEPFMKAQIKFVNHSLGLAMLEATGNYEYGELVADGSLYPGQPLLPIGVLNNYVGSTSYGKVAFQCENVEFDPDTYEACKTYQSSKYDTPLTHLKMGDIMNDESQADLGEFDEQLNALIPIIHCDAFPGESEFLGAPIFNVQGTIVGISDQKYAGYYVAIHVSAIKAFLRTKPPNEGTSRRRKRRSC